MELSVTMTQALAVKAALSAQATVLYAKDGNDPTKVGIISLLDPRGGEMLLRWANANDAPTVAAFLAQVPTAVEVADITG